MGRCHLGDHHEIVVKEPTPAVHLGLAILGTQLFAGQGPKYRANVRECSIGSLKYSLNYTSCLNYLVKDRKLRIDIGKCCNEASVGNQDRFYPHT